MVGKELTELVEALKGGHNKGPSQTDLNLALAAAVAVAAASSRAKCKNVNQNGVANKANYEKDE